jgi:hypothetical protein
MFTQVNVGGDAFVARGWNRALKFNNRIVLIAGRSGGTYYNDVVDIGDGVVLNQLLADGHTQFERRGSFGACVHNKRLYIASGLPTFFNDVHSSLDGIHWTEETGSAEWPRRYDGEICSYDGRLWMLGGRWTTNLNDVWNSVDGKTWTQILANGHTQFSGREDHRLLVHKGMMILIGGLSGGTGVDDIYASRDGVHWELLNSAITSSALGIYNHSVISVGERIVLINGANGAAHNDLYHSTDGVHWVGPIACEFPARDEFGLVEWNERIYVIGGDSTATTLNDVWVMPVDNF